MFTVLTFVPMLLKQWWVKLWGSWPESRPPTVLGVPVNLSLPCICSYKTQNKTKERFSLKNVHDDVVKL